MSSSLDDAVFTMEHIYAVLGRITYDIACIESDVPEIESIYEIRYKSTMPFNDLDRILDEARGYAAACIAALKEMLSREGGGAL